MKYVRDIVDAIHNIPHSMKQSDKFLEFELKLLQETLYMDFGKVAVEMLHILEHFLHVIMYRKGMKGYNTIEMGRWRMMQSE